MFRKKNNKLMYFKNPIGKKSGYKCYGEEAESLSHKVVSDLISDKVGNFNFSGTAIRRDGGAEPQLLVSVQKY